MKKLLPIWIFLLIAQICDGQDTIRYTSWSAVSIILGMAEGLGLESHFTPAWTSGIGLAKWEGKWVFQSQLLYHRSRVGRSASTGNIRFHTWNFDLLMGRMISSNSDEFKVTISGGLSLQHGGNNRIEPNSTGFYPMFVFLRDRQLGIGGLVLVDFTWSKRPLGNGAYLFMNSSSIGNYFGSGLNITLFSKGK